MKKLLAAVLAMAMILSLGVTAFAAAQNYDADGAVVDTQTNDVAEDGGTADTQFKVIDKSATIPTYQMSVTVPMTVTFAVAQDGTTSVPSKYKLINYSFKDISVSNVKAVNGNWTLATEAAAKAADEGSKTVNMNIKGLDLSTTTDGVAPGWDSVKAATSIDGTELDLVLTAVAAPQNSTNETPSAEDAFKVTYTIAMPTVTP